MEKTLPSSNLYSHPGILLEDHLIKVAELSELFLSEKPVGIREKLNNICRIIALTHDIGKATKYFQDYLNANEQEKERLRKLKETWHGLLSAICTYYLIKEIKIDDIWPIFAFIAVRKHHGDLRDVIDDVIFDSEDAEILHRQIGSIKDESFSVLCSMLYKAGLPLLLDKQIISRWIDSFVKDSRQIKRFLRAMKSDLSNYIMLNLIYSILLDSDKSEVVVKDRVVFNRKKFEDEEWVDVYKKQTSFPESPINALRKKAYQETLNHDIDLNKKIYSLNIPTGLGKTLASLSFALRLRKAIKSNNGIKPRIVYALPFLSIIDQNSEVFESVIKTNNIEPDTSILLKHHHLSEVFYKREDDEFESDEAKILIEGWNSEIIVTTFVQLFHTLISNKNRSIRKFHRLASSIIILDEIQSIPVKYWLVLRNVLLELANLINTYIIFVTATEPMIFDPGEMTPLVNRDFYFNSLDRVSMKPLIDKTMTISELIEHFDLNDERTYLFIFNTITSARDFYNLIKDNAESITYLSTLIIPKERLKRIKEIKDGKYKVIISTQLVEAGVDIDLDVVIRDIAPLDSINQASGRCNRNGKQKGEVYIVNLKDERDRRLATYVYDATLLNITEQILSNKEEIKEGQFLQLIKEYYLKTKDAVSHDTSRSLLAALSRLKYDSEGLTNSIESFRLIDDDYKKIDVFIELDDNAHNIWQKYISLKNVTDVFERKKLFDAIKANFYQYVISIPANVENIPPMFGEIGYVNMEVLRDYYDTETGYITKETRHTVIW